MTNPAHAARLILDILETAVDGDEEPLDAFLLAFLDDPRTVDADEAGPIVATVAPILVQVLVPLIRRKDPRGGAADPGNTE